jgi:hypothetical protein
MLHDEHRPRRSRQGGILSGGISELSSCAAPGLDARDPTLCDRGRDRPRLEHRHNSAIGPRSSLELSSFTGGNTLKATTEIQHPYMGKHESRVAIDTQSDVTTCLRELLVDVHAIVPDIVEGCRGAANFTEEDTLYVYSPTERNSVAVPALLALPHQLPTDCVALLGVPALLALEVAVEQHLKLPRFVPLQCHLGEREETKRLVQ